MLLSCILWMKMIMAMALTSVLKLASTKYILSLYSKQQRGRLQKDYQLRRLACDRLPLETLHFSPLVPAPLFLLGFASPTLCLYLALPRPLNDTKDRSDSISEAEFRRTTYFETEFVYELYPNHFGNISKE